jgi:hypothetical protein
VESGDSAGSEDRLANDSTRHDRGSTPGIGAIDFEEEKTA